MSHSLLPETQPSLGSGSTPTYQRQDSFSSASVSRSSDFDYKPVPVLAPVTLLLGIGSLIGLLSVPALSISLAGVITGTICLVKIRRSGGELGGRWVAMSGWCLSLGILFGGSSWHAYAYATEVPEGYVRVNFPRDISRREFTFVNGRLGIHPEIQKLDGQQIFTKGYIWQTRFTEGLDSFILLKDNGKCCFGGQAKPNDMIGVKMQNGKTVSAYTGLVSVAGVFHCNPDAAPGEPIYTLEATHFSPARTAY